MKRTFVAFALFLAGCVTDRTLGLEIRPPRGPDGGIDLPAEVAAFEVRLSRLEGDEACPTVDEAASASGPGRLAHAQSFSVEDGMGMAIGEVPSGRWAVAALARDADCAVVLYGCTDVTFDGETSESVVVDLTPSTSIESCGDCRTCDTGACAPIEARCD